MGLRFILTAMAVILHVMGAVCPFDMLYRRAQSRAYAIKTSLWEVYFTVSSCVKTRKDADFLYPQKRKTT